jgi:hypothetical protein
VEGFRVRLAATVSTDAETEEFGQFLDEQKNGAEDRVIRRIALHCSAAEGVAVTRADLVPEVTITADGVYWHPVGAQDTDLLVTHNIFPLSEAFAVRSDRLSSAKAEHANKLVAHERCSSCWRRPGWLKIPSISQADLKNPFLSPRVGGSGV